MPSGGVAREPALNMILACTDRDGDGRGCGHRYIGDVQGRCITTRFQTTSTPTTRSQMAKGTGATRGVCLRCNKPLSAIGHARKNGAKHADWNKRLYHKKSWKAIQGTALGAWPKFYKKKGSKKPKFYKKKGWRRF